jgi:FlgD Ig-like domain
VAVFVVGVVVAMTTTQHLRSEGPIASRIAFKAEPGPPYRVCFQTPRDDTFEVAIVDSEGRLVTVLASGVELEGDPAADKGSAHCFDWDGFDDAGTPAPPGVYRLSLALEEADRQAVSGEKLKVTEPAAPPSAGGSP